MEKICAELRHMFDFTIIDSPAGSNGAFKMPSSAQTKSLLLLLRTSPLFAMLTGSSACWKRRRKQHISLVVNRLQPEMVRRGDMLDIPDMMDILSIEPLGMIPEDESIVISSNRGDWPL